MKQWLENTLFKPSEREDRFALLKMSKEIFFIMLFRDSISTNEEGQKTVTFVRFEGLPIGCEIIQIELDTFPDTITLLLWHESFDVVPSGGKIPTLDITITPEVFVLPPFPWTETGPQFKETKE